MFRQLKRNLDIIKRCYIKAIAFRSEVFLWIILDALPMVVLLFVWLSMYQGQTTLVGFSLGQILQYYFLVSLINGFTASHFESWRVQEIRDGKIDYFLSKPLHYLQELLLREIGGKLLYLTFSIPFFVVLLIILNKTLGLTFLLPSLQNGLLFLALLSTTFIIEFLIASIIVMAGFWFEYAEGLEHFKWLIVTMLSGWMIPVAMMPTVLKGVVQALPFRYMYDVPINIIQGNRAFEIFDLAYLLGFIATLILIRNFIWSKAQYRYSSQGG